MTDGIFPKPLAALAWSATVATVFAFLPSFVADTAVAVFATASGWGWLVLRRGEAPATTDDATRASCTMDVLSRRRQAPSNTNCRPRSTRCTTNWRGPVPAGQRDRGVGRQLCGHDGKYPGATRPSPAVSVTRDLDGKKAAGFGFVCSSTAVMQGNRRQRDCEQQSRHGTGGAYRRHIAKHRQRRGYPR